MSDGSIGFVKMSSNCNTPFLASVFISSKSACEIRSCGFTILTWVGAYLSKIIDVSLAMFGSPLLFTPNSTWVRYSIPSFVSMFNLKTSFSPVLKLCVDVIDERSILVPIVSPSPASAFSREPSDADETIGAEPELPPPPPNSDLAPATTLTTKPARAIAPLPQPGKNDVLSTVLIVDTLPYVRVTVPQFTSVQET